jgi:putative pyruvate formate lyase activating enzyme
MPQILAALPTAIAGGLRLPLIYNTSGYERVETLRLLEDIIDIWLPDAKYAANRVAMKHSGFPNYVEQNRAALQELYRQVGPNLDMGEMGLARRGMIVRHLVLPFGIAGTDEVLPWVANNLSPNIHVSLMDQYFPAHQAIGDPVLGRKVTLEEYEAALDACEAAGLENGWCQETTRDITL